MRPDELLTDLDPSQRAAVTEPAVPLAILAPAGSGKTRALTRRIAWQSAEGHIDPNHVLAVTFTRKAAGELRGRLSRLGVRGAVTAGTFHAVALAQLRRRHQDLGTPMPGLLDRKARLLGPLIGGKRGADLAVAINEIAAEVEWAKARRVPPNAYEQQVRAARRETPRPPDEVAQIYAGYEREKRKRGLLDFDDLIGACTGDARERCRVRGRAALALPAPVRRRVPGRDPRAAGPAAGLARRPLGPVCRRRPRPGDLRVRRRRRGAAQQLRSRVPGLRRRPARRELPLDPPDRAGRPVRPPAAERATVRAAGPEGEPAEVVTYADGDAEARGVADALYRAHGPMRPWSSMAVLYRVNAQSAPFEEALRRAGVPYRVRGAAAFLDRPEVKAVMDALRKNAKAAPGRAFAEHITDLVSDAADLSEDRREHVDAVAALGREYLAAEGSTGSVAGFQEYLRGVVARRRRRRADR